MWILKTLGIVDIVIAIAFWIFGVFRFPFLSGLILIGGLILLAKGFIFITGLSFSSFADIVCGLIIIAASSGYANIVVVIIISIFLLQKGIFSLWN